MAEKNGDDNPYTFGNFDGNHSEEKQGDNSYVPDPLELDFGSRNHRNLDQMFDTDPSLSSYGRSSPVF